MKRVLVLDASGLLSTRTVRLLHEAARLGEVHLVLPSDAALRIAGREPKYPLAERMYFFESVRFVTAVHIADALPAGGAPPVVHGAPFDLWAALEDDESEARRTAAEAAGLEYRGIPEDALSGFPDDEMSRGNHRSSGTGKTVVVTGCYDWFHSGHVRFFEEASRHGDLYVVVGHDANIRLLKGEGHPMFPEEERRYSVQSIKFVKRALVSSGDGWMDAEPEIVDVIRPDIYAVNEDGDKPEKREFCERRGIEYLVMKRTPKEGLPRRSSTDLRGF